MMDNSKVITFITLFGIIVMGVVIYQYFVVWDETCPINDNVVIDGDIYISDDAAVLVIEDLREAKYIFANISIGQNKTSSLSYLINSSTSRIKLNQSGIYASNASLIRLDNYTNTNSKILINKPIKFTVKGIKYRSGCRIESIIRQEAFVIDEKGNITDI